MKNKIKDRNFAFRIAVEDLDTIKAKAERAEMSMTDFFTKSALGKEIVVIDNLDPIRFELKAIGNNLNRLTVLANMGKVEVANLTETRLALEKIHSDLAKISEVI